MAQRDSVILPEEVEDVRRLTFFDLELARQRARVDDLTDLPRRFEPVASSISDAKGDLEVLEKPDDK